MVPVAITVGFCVIYGLADELHQLLVPARVFDGWDLAADALGAAFGAVGRALWARRRTGAGGGG